MVHQNKQKQSSADKSRLYTQIKLIIEWMHAHTRRCEKKGDKFTRAGMMSTIYLVLWQEREREGYIPKIYVY